jgi:hypothetical protein
LEAYLAGPGNDDPEDRHDLEATLDLYKDEVRPCSLATPVTEAKIELDRLMLDPVRIRGYGFGVKVSGSSNLIPAMRVTIFATRRVSIGILIRKMTP